MTIFVRFVPFLLLLALARVEADEASGLVAQYYPSVDFSGTPVTRIDSTLDFDWSTDAPMPGIPADGFSICWSGQLLAPNTETYTFTTTSDDGILVWVNGHLIIDNWTSHAAAQDSGSIALVAGQKYDLKVRYFDSGGYAVAKLAWSSPSIPQQIVPASQLFQPVAVAASALAIRTLAESRVNPAWVEGSIGGPDASVVGAIHGSGAVVIRESGTLWFLNGSAVGKPLGIPLSATEATPISVTSTAGDAHASATQSITWTPTDLSDLPYGLVFQALRVGDQLLLTAGKAGAALAIDTNYDGNVFNPTLQGSPGQLFPTTFSSEGVYDIHAQIDGVDAGDLKVIVVASDLQGPIACEEGYKRIKDVVSTSVPDATSLIAYTADDDSRLIVGRQSSGPAGSRLTLLPLFNDRRPVLQSRLSSSSGPIITQQPIDVFSIHTSAEKSIAVITQYPDGSILAEAQLTMQPLVRDLDIKMNAFIAGVTFGDSTSELDLSTNDFSAFQDRSGTYNYQMIRGPNIPHGFCHAFIVYQAGIQISN